ncbi:MAG: NAD(P)-dependent oxidoreductase [Armatimonadetes bacterium]|nr:NAD(P)-dependent oxidoreductase [Armatimonadota bacterium]
MKILVTGGAGYLGSVLVPRLLQAGHQVRVLDRLMYDPTSLLGCFAWRGFEFVRADARDAEALRAALADVDAIIPLAALVGMPLCEERPEEATSTNLEAVRLLNELRSPEQRVLFANTNSGYGTRTGEAHCTEDTPMEPISLYGRTKVEAERLLLDSPNTLTFRFATLFGVSPRMRLDLLVNDFTWRAVNDGYLVLYEKNFRRNYLHLQDAAGCFLHALEHWDEMVGRPYNAGLEDANLTKEELALRIREHVPGLTIYEGDVGRDVDRRDYVVSNERLYATGFRPQWSLDDGIEQLIAAFELLPKDPLRNY